MQRFERTGSPERSPRRRPLVAAAITLALEVATSPAGGQALVAPRRPDAQAPAEPADPTPTGAQRPEPAAVAVPSPGEGTPASPVGGAPAVPGMGLAQALAYADAHQPQRRVAAARVELRREQAREPGARWLPRIGTTLQATYGSNNNSATNWLGSGGVVEFPRIAGTGFLQQPSDINWMPYVSTAGGITVEQRLFDSGRVAAETAAADAELEVARDRADADELHIELAVREAYFAVLAARAVLAAAEDAVARATVHRDEARALVERGLRPRVELDRFEADVARFDAGRIRARGGVLAAQGALASAVGFNAPLLDAADDVPLPPLLPSLDEALRISAAHDPLVRAALAEVRAARARTQAAEAELRPEIHAVATAMSAAGGAPREHTNDQTFGTGFVPWVPDYYVGVVLVWRLFDPVMRARVDTARRVEDVARAEADVARNAQTAAVVQAWTAVDVAQRTLPALERAADAARTNYASVEARYRAGLGTSVELADAAALRTDSEIQVALGRFQLVRARAQFARAIAEGH